MRIAFVTKRHYTNQDLIAARFGRLFHLPTALAAAGHDVAVLAADYRSGGGSTTTSIAGVPFTSLPVRGVASLRFWPRLRSHIREFAPDVVVGSADTHFGWLAQRLARSLAVPSVFDVYDNYLAFASGRMPGAGRLFRRVVSRSDLVTAASEPLAELVRPYNPSVAVLVNGVDRHLFRSVDRNEARSLAGLQEDVELVGYVGSIEPHRGIEELIAAVSRLRDGGRNLVLVMAGVDKLESRWRTEWIHYLGVVPQDRIPAVINSCDVAVLPYLDDEWGRYTYPNKLAEYVACGIPVVATDIPQFAAILSEPAVCGPGDPTSMAAAIERQLTDPVVTDPAVVSSWSELGLQLAGELAKLSA